MIVFLRVVVQASVDEILKGVIVDEKVDMEAANDSVKVELG